MLDTPNPFDVIPVQPGIHPEMPPIPQSQDGPGLRRENIVGGEIPEETPWSTISSTATARCSPKTST
ncbi:hypothetical protein [uncultured Devosia sp.]|uniref:hypothetical protein n=1 Tax=uncultured Devosia sp. TaxID=211434 RepID=UPI0035CA752E